MFQKIVAVLLFSAIPSSGFAEWVGGVGLRTWSDVKGATLNTLAGSIGYQFGSQHKGLKFIPEFRYGIGINDDVGNINDNPFISEDDDLDFEIDHFLILSVKGLYGFTNGAYIFGLIGWGDLHTEATLEDPRPDVMGTITTRSSDNAVGFGLGTGFRFNELVVTELSLERYGEIDTLSLALKFHF